MIPNCRVSGKVRYQGSDIFDTRLDLQQLRREIGMIFQKPTPFPLSIRRNIELPLREQGMRKQSELNDRIAQVLQGVGLWDEVKNRLHTPAQALSGGQQQRL